MRPARPTRSGNDLPDGLLLFVFLLLFFEELRVFLLGIAARAGFAVAVRGHAAFALAFITVGDGFLAAGLVGFRKGDVGQQRYGKNGEEQGLNGFHVFLWKLIQSVWFAVVSGNLATKPICRNNGHVLLYRRRGD